MVKMNKKRVAAALAASMVLTQVPAVAFAAESTITLPVTLNSQVADEKLVQYDISLFDQADGAAIETITITATAPFTTAGWVGGGGSIGFSTGYDDEWVQKDFGTDTADGDNLVVTIDFSDEYANGGIDYEAAADGGILQIGWWWGAGDTLTITDIQVTYVGVEVDDTDTEEPGDTDTDTEEPGDTDTDTDTEEPGDEDDNDAVTDDADDANDVVDTDASDNDASDNDASDNDASDNDASDNNASENDATDNDASDNDATDNDASDNDATDNDASDNDATDNDASDNDANGGDDSTGNDANDGNDNTGNDANGGDDNTGNDANGGDDNTGNDANGGDDNTGNDANGGDDNIDRLPGDVNGDGVVDLKDVVLERRYVAGWDLSEVTFIEANADVNADNEISAKDVVLIRRYVAEWTGIELL